MRALVPPARTVTFGVSGKVAPVDQVGAVVRARNDLKHAGSRVRLEVAQFSCPIAPRTIAGTVDTEFSDVPVASTVWKAIHDAGTVRTLSQLGETALAEDAPAASDLLGITCRKCTYETDEIVWRLVHELTVPSTHGHLFWFLAHC